MVLGRRRFLALSFGSSATALLGTAAVSSAAPNDPVSVWRLSANWGYAVPPKGRTRCKCSACHSHAANRVFSTSGAALADRIHPCCVCQPFSISISQQGFDSLFSSTTSIDLRDPGVRAAFETAVNDLIAAPTTVPTTAPTSVPAATPPTTVAPPSIVGPSPTVAEQPVATTDDARSDQSPSAGSGAAAPSTGSQGLLPTTGSDTSSLLIAAALLTAAGAAIALGTSERGAKSLKAHDGCADN